MRKNIENYNPDFIDTVLGYLNNYVFLGIELDSIYNFNKKEKQALAKIIQQYHKTTLYKDAKYEYLKELEPQITLNMANSFLIAFFPKLEKEILELDKTILFKNIKPEEQGVHYRIKPNYIEINKILLDNSFNEYTIPKIVHEKVHALCFNNIDTINLFNNSLELLPIFIQKIVIYELGKYTDSPISVFDTIIRNNDNNISSYALKYADYLNNKKDKTKLDDLVAQYFRIRSTDYILADIYSNVLVNHYIEDRNNMIENLNKLFENKITIEEFLNIYNISLLNKANIPTMKEKLEKCKRKIIIP